MELSLTFGEQVLVYGVRSDGWCLVGRDGAHSPGRYVQEGFVKGRILASREPHDYGVPLVPLRPCTPLPAPGLSADLRSSNSKAYVCRVLRIGCSQVEKIVIST
jgi:hypothetical protein